MTIHFCVRSPICINDVSPLHVRIGSIENVEETTNGKVLIQLQFIRADTHIKVENEQATCNVEQATLYVGTLNDDGTWEFGN